jgi:hypothetical protein
MSNNKQSRYKYIGEDYWFIKNGDIIEGEPTTWSIAIPDSRNRTTIKCFYFDGVGFDGKSVAIFLDKFENL